jgi:hypothetical protein
MIALEGRWKCSFVPCPVGSVDFDSHWCEKLELHKVDVLEIHNVGNVSSFGKHIRRRGRT